MSARKITNSELSTTEVSQEFERTMQQLQGMVDTACRSRAQLDYIPSELWKVIRSSRDKIRTAISEKETYKITSSYLQAALSLIEWTLYTEGRLEKKTQKLLHSCLTITVENSEENEDQRKLIVFRIWIWRLMLRIDSGEGSAVNANRVRNIVDHQKKIHQKFFDQKLYSVWIAYTEAKRSRDADLQDYALTIMRDFNSVLALQIGGADTTVEKSNLRFAAFVRSLEITTGSKELFAMMFVVTKLLILARYYQDFCAETIEDNFNKVRNIILTYLKDNDELLDVVDYLIEIIRRAYQEKKHLIQLKKETETQELKPSKRANRYYLKKKVLVKSVDKFREDYNHYERQLTQDEIENKEKLIAKGISASLISKWSAKKEVHSSSTLKQKGYMQDIATEHGIEQTGGQTPATSRPPQVDWKLDFSNFKIKPKAAHHTAAGGSRDFVRASGKFRLQSARVGHPTDTANSSTNNFSYRAAPRLLSSSRCLNDKTASQYVMIESKKDSNRSQPVLRNYKQMKELVKNSLKEANKMMAKGPISVTEDVIIDSGFKSSTQRRSEDWQTLKYKLIRMQWMKNATKHAQEERAELLPREVIKYPPQFMLLDRPIEVVPKQKSKVLRASVSKIGTVDSNIKSVQMLALMDSETNSKVRLDEQTINGGADLNPTSAKSNTAGEKYNSAKGSFSLRDNILKPVRGLNQLVASVKKVMTLNKVTSIFAQHKSKVSSELMGTVIPASKDSVREELRQGEGINEISSSLKVRDENTDRLQNLLPQPIESSESNDEDVSGYQEGLSMVRSKNMSIGKSEIGKGEKTLRGLYLNSGDQSSPNGAWAKRRMLRIDTNKEDDHSITELADEAQLRIEQSQRFVSQNSLNRQKLNGRKPIDGLVKESEHNQAFRAFMKTFLNGLEIILVSNRSFAMRRLKQIFIVGTNRGFRRLNTMEAARNISSEIQVLEPFHDEIQPPDKREGAFIAIHNKGFNLGETLVAGSASNKS